MRLLWTGGWGDAKWISAWYTPIAPSLSVSLTPFNTTGRLFLLLLFKWYSADQGAPAHASKHTRTLNKIQRHMHPPRTTWISNTRNSQLHPAQHPTRETEPDTSWEATQKITDIKQSAHKRSHPKRQKLPTTHQKQKLCSLYVWSNQATAQTLTGQPSRLSDESKMTRIESQS